MAKSFSTIFIILVFFFTFLLICDATFFGQGSEDINDDGKHACKQKSKSYPGVVCWSEDDCYRDCTILEKAKSGSRWIRCFCHFYWRSADLIKMSWYIYWFMFWLYIYTHKYIRSCSCYCKILRLYKVLSTSLL